MQNTASGPGTVGSRFSGTLKCFDGDSGGPVFAYTTAFGVVGECGVYAFNDQLSTDPYIRAAYLLFTAVDVMEDKDVTIVVP